MVAAMAGFAVEDVLIKQMSSAMPVGQVLALIGTGGAILFSVIAAANGYSVFSRAALSRPLMFRNLTEAIGSGAFVTALALSTLSAASAILQATPLAVTLGAAVFLREPVGWRRWTAIGIGFAGVLLIIQPGMDGFTPAALFALLAVVMLAARDISSRVIPAAVSSLQVAAWGFFSLLPAGLVTLAIAGESPEAMAAADLGRLATALAVGGAGYYALVAATRIGELSAVMPFRYTRLVFALLLGFAIFDERPDALMLAGAALIVGTGLYTIWRSALRQRLANAPPALPSASTLP